MDPIYIIAVILVVTLTGIFVARYIDAVAEKDLLEVASWRGLPTEERLSAHTTFTERLVRERSLLVKIAAPFIVGVAGAGFLIIAALNANAEDVEHQAAAAEEQAQTNCMRFRQFITITAEDADQTIRDAARERDELADAIANETGDIESIPGYDQLGPGVKNFLDGLVAAQIVEAEVELARRDDELEGLRNWEDAISQFEGTLNCPE
jgi:uncharacterized membrane protein